MAKLNFNKQPVSSVVRTVLPGGMPIPQKEVQATRPMASGWVTTVKQRTRALIIVGRSGMGKSALCAQFPNTAFLCDDQELGILDLKQSRQVPASIPVWEPPMSSWKMALSTLDMIIDRGGPTENGFNTLAVEALTGWERLCFRYCCDEEFRGDWAGKDTGFFSYAKGPKTAAKKYWPDFIKRLETIRNQDIHVLLTGHTHGKNEKNLVGNDYNKETCYLDPDIWQATHAWAEAILVMTLDVKTETKGLKTNVVTQTRYIHCEQDAAYAGKNRLGIDLPIECGSSARETYTTFCREVKLDPLTCHFK